MILNNTIPAAGKNICGTATGVSYAITAAYFCNLSTNAEILNVYLVSNGGGVGAASQIINNLTIDPADTFVLDTEKLVLENGDYIYGTSQSGNISAVFSVMNIS